VRPRLNLNGTWEFRLDPQDEGVAQEWFRADVDYPDRIQVPGNWQAQGFGEPRAHLRHDYQGKAWYRRIVTIPGAWAGRRVWLHLGGVTNTADVFVNGQQVGFVEGFLTPYEFDVTEAVTPGGENVLACRVDSTGPAPVGMFNFWGRWGGLYRPAWLEARSDPMLDDLFVRPDVENATARTQVVLRRNAPGKPWEGRLAVRITPVRSQARSEAECREVPVRLGEGQTESEPALVDIQVRDLHPWSPEDPFLYEVEVSLLENGTAIDVVRDRFGMRQFEIGEGGKLLLNGRPYFVRGLGDDCVEVLSGTLVPDKQVYLDRIRLCKRYGYNGFRYLAHTPAQEVFEAADEAGFLIMAEGAIYWKVKEVIPRLKRQVARIARAYRNHPSWYVWSAGNELFECQGPDPDPDWMDYILYAHDTFRQLDPTRFFVASDGADVFPTDLITQAAKFSATPPAYDQPFDGLVDEVAYSRSVLTDADMARLAQPEAGYAELVRSFQPSGYWRLDETAPGKAADSSGHGHDGAYDPAMPADHFNQPGVLGEEGGAVRFAPGVPPVSLQAVVASVFAEKDQPFSVSLWIKPNGFRRGDWGTPFSWGAASDLGAFLISLDGEGGDGKVTLGRWMSNLPTSEGRLTAGRWNHIGITYDGATARLYLNGVPDRAVEVKLSVVPVDGRIGNLVRESVTDPTKYQSLPHLWHEFNNTYVGPLPDLTIDERYTGVFRDNDCLARHRREIADYGLTDRYAEIRQRSIDLFYLYLKQMYEGARSSPTLDGYAYWLMTDVPGGVEGDHNSLGLFSTLYEPEKFPDPAPILRFNRETVLFIKAGPDRRVLGAGETRMVSLGLSHYGEEPIREGRLFWTVTSGPETLAEGILENVTAEVGEVKAVGVLQLGPYQPAQGRKLILSVRLEAEACHQENEWDFWVFPRSRSHTLPLPHAYAPAAPNQARVVVADQLTDDLVDDLTDGGRVVLLAESGVLARPGRFTYWPEWIRHVGNVVEDHPALAGFPHDGFCAYQFYRLFGAFLETVSLTEKSEVEYQKLTPIVWGMKTDYDPALGLSWADPNNRWKLYREGLICEGRVGQGKLLVCCLRVLEGLRNGYPEAGYLLDCLVDYARSERFAPTAPPLTAEEVRQVFRLASPRPGP